MEIFGKFVDAAPTRQRELQAYQFVEKQLGRTRVLSYGLDDLDGFPFPVVPAEKKSAIGGSCSVVALVAFLILTVVDAVRLNSAVVGADDAYEYNTEVRGMHGGPVALDGAAVELQNMDGVYDERFFTISFYGEHYFNVSFSSANGATPTDADCARVVPGATYSSSRRLCKDPQLLGTQSVEHPQAMTERMRDDMLVRVPGETEDKMASFEVGGHFSDAIASGGHFYFGEIDVKLCEDATSDGRPCANRTELENFFGVWDQTSDGNRGRKVALWTSTRSTPYGAREWVSEFRVNLYLEQYTSVNSYFTVNVAKKRSAWGWWRDKQTWATYDRTENKVTYVVDDEVFVPGRSLAQIHLRESAHSYAVKANVYTFFEFLTTLGANSNLVLIVFGYFAIRVNKKLARQGDTRSARVHDASAIAVEAPAPSPSGACDDAA